MKAIEMSAEQAGIFGYGSLLCINSLERTLGHKYTGPFEPCWLQGWRRTWNVIMPNESHYYTQVGDEVFYPKNIVYLNIRSAPGEQVIGTLFIINKDELPSYDAREWIYNRHDVSNMLSGIAVMGGPIFAYVGKPQYEVMGPKTPREAAVRITYLETIESGLHNLGTMFRRGYEESSDPVPEHLIIKDKCVR